MHTSCEVITKEKKSNIKDLAIWIPHLWAARKCKEKLKENVNGGFVLFWRLGFRKYFIEFIKTLCNERCCMKSLKNPIENDTLYCPPSTVVVLFFADIKLMFSHDMAIRRIFSKAYTSYKSALDDAFNRKNLFYTNVLLSMGISLMGDSIEQRYELYKGDIEQYDASRTAHMGFSGATAGVICHHWYNFIDRVIVGRTLYMVIKKLMLDQFVCSPIVILSFFATVAIFEENPITNFTEEVQDKFWTLYKAEWVVWPPAQIINFYFLPTRFRVLYDNTISLGYDIYTSHVKHDKSFTSKKEKNKNSD